MSLSLRTHRVAVYAYSNTGTGGAVKPTYTRSNSTDDDRLWWASRGLPTGRESTVGFRPEHRVDAVFGFAAEVPLTTNGLILAGGVQYLIRAILPRDLGTDEVQVLAERNQQPSTLTNPA